MPGESPNDIKRSWENALRRTTAAHMCRGWWALQTSGPLRGCKPMAPRAKPHLGGRTGHALMHRSKDRVRSARPTEGITARRMRKTSASAGTAREIAPHLRAASGLRKALLRSCARISWRSRWLVKPRCEAVSRSGNGPGTCRVGLRVSSASQAGRPGETSGHRCGSRRDGSSRSREAMCGSASA